MQFGGVKAVGLFSVALIMRESLSILPQSVHQVFMPRAAESFARDGGVGKAARSTFKVAGIFSVFMLVAILITAFLLDFFVPCFIPKYSDGLPLMKVCLIASIVPALSLPLNGLAATGRSWLYGKGILVGLLIFPVVSYLLNSVAGGMLAVAIGSLIGRLARVAVAYADLFVLLRRERC